MKYNNENTKLKMFLAFAFLLNFVSTENVSGTDTPNTSFRDSLIARRNSVQDKLDDAQMKMDDSKYQRDQIIGARDNTLNGLNSQQRYEKSKELNAEVARLNREHFSASDQVKRLDYEAKELDAQIAEQNLFHARLKKDYAGKVYRENKTQENLDKRWKSWINETRAEKDLEQAEKTRDTAKLFVPRR